MEVPYRFVTPPLSDVYIILSQDSWPQTPQPPYLTKMWCTAEGPRSRQYDSSMRWSVTLLLFYSTVCRDRFGLRLARDCHSACLPSFSLNFGCVHPERGPSYKLCTRASALDSTSCVVSSPWWTMSRSSLGLYTVSDALTNGIKRDHFNLRVKRKSDERNFHLKVFLKYYHSICGLL